jgi:hypothetical protein
MLCNHTCCLSFISFKPYRDNIQISCPGEREYRLAQTAPKTLGWHVGFWNLIGGMGFTVPPWASSPRHSSMPWDYRRMLGAMGFLGEDRTYHHAFLALSLGADLCECHVSLDWLGCAAACTNLWINTRSRWKGLRHDFRLGEGGLDEALESFLMNQKGARLEELHTFHGEPLVSSYSRLHTHFVSDVVHNLKLISVGHSCSRPVTPLSADHSYSHRARSWTDEINRRRCGRKRAPC